MATDTAAPCQFLGWDSEFFGHRIGRITSTASETLDLRAVDIWRRANHVECLYCLVAPEDRRNWRALEAGGFQFVDMRLTVTLPATVHPPDKGVLDAALVLRPAAEADVPDLRALAAASHGQTRFFNDGHFARDRCRELYATWIEQSCRDAAAQVWVAEWNGQLAGYSTNKVYADGSAQVGLVAVASTAQRRGVGRAVLLTAVHALRARGAGTVNIVLQGGNLAAYNLYRQVGFETADWALWYHGWFNDEPVSDSV